MELSIAHNNISGVKIEKYALSSETGVANFCVWGENSSGDSLRNSGRLESAPAIVRIETRRLDDLDNKGCLTVMKLDCEGAELDILRGSVQTLEKVRPLILCEFHIVNRKAFATGVDDIFSFLQNVEYRLLSLKFELLSKEDFMVSQEHYEENYLLLPAEIFHSLRDKISENI
jgi:FkbM family methyltransferase